MYYLKYRPSKFSELFGLEDVAEGLTKALQKKQVAHAYVFTGPKGSGKTTTARILAKALNCENLGKDGEPCNECHSCEAVNQGRFLDLIEIDAASNRGIDDIRDLREKIKLSPSIGKFKIYIVDEVHMLTAEAFNALLKTLEEPPSHAVFVLATTEYSKIPETIKSRCQVIRFRRGRRSDLVAKLKFICEKEKVNVSPEKLERIAELSEGGFRNAETLLEQVVVGEIDLDKYNFSASEFVELLIKGDRKGALEFLDHVVEAGENVSVFNQAVIYYLRNLLLILGGVGDDVLDVGRDPFELMRDQAQKLHHKRLTAFLEIFLRAEDRSKYSPLPQLPLELAVFDATSVLKEGFAEESDEDLVETLPGDKLKENKVVGNFRLTLDQVKEKWESLLKAVRPFNHSLEALLRSSRPKEVLPEGELVIEVFYKFHKDRLTAAANNTILQNVMSQVFGGAPILRYTLADKKLEASHEENVKPAGSEDLVSAALEAFGA